MSFLSGVLENLKADELKRLELYVQEKAYIPRKLDDILKVRGIRKVLDQIDAFYARGRYPLETAIPFFEFYSSRDCSKIACLHITYRNGNIPVIIDLNPQFPKEMIEGIKKEVQENSLIRIDDDTGDIFVGEVIIDEEELLFSFKEL